jgi:flagellar FliJ protein
MPIEKKSKRMQPILRVAESRQQQAAAAVGEAQSHLNMQQARLEELQNYYAEYVANMQQQMRVGAPITKVQGFKGFLVKLDQAIEQQKQSVQAAHQQLQQRKQVWMASRGQVKMYNNVISRFRAKELQAAEHREQKETDERAQRVHSRNR